MFNSEQAALQRMASSYERNQKKTNAAVYLFGPEILGSNFAKASPYLEMAEQLMGALPREALNPKANVKASGGAMQVGLPEGFMPGGIIGATTGIADVDRRKEFMAGLLGINLNDSRFHGGYGNSFAMGY